MEFTEGRIGVAPRKRGGRKVVLMNFQTWERGA